MIFGFNTDVRHGQTVYHVQSEARASDLLIQSEVFVRGRCIGKHATSYAEQATQTGFSEEHIHELLKEQHRAVLAAIREGSVETFLSGRAVQNADGTGLALELLEAPPGSLELTVMLRLRVTFQATPVAGAHVTARWADSEGRADWEAVTDSYGVAGLVIPVEETGESAILVQATHRGLSAVRKIRLRRTGN